MTRPSRACGRRKRLRRTALEAFGIFLKLLMVAGFFLIGFNGLLGKMTDSSFWGAKTLADEVLAAEQGEGDSEEEGQALLEAYQERNADVVGHIRIPGTVLDHPLVQTKNDEDYYLYRDLDKHHNSHGVPFLSAASEMEAVGGNLVIYGHNIHLHGKDVFGDLAGYESLSYYQEHPLIETVSVSGTRRWLIFAYFLTDNSDPEPFRYSDYTDFSSPEEFAEFSGEVEKRNWLDVDGGVSYGDSLITLSSCSNELAGSGTNRMVVVGKLLKAGEEYQGIVDSAGMAGHPLLPQKLEVLCNLT